MESVDSIVAYLLKKKLILLATLISFPAHSLFLSRIKIFLTELASNFLSQTADEVYLATKHTSEVILGQDCASYYSSMRKNIPIYMFPF